MGTKRESQPERQITQVPFRSYEWDAYQLLFAAASLLDHEEYETTLMRRLLMTGMLGELRQARTRMRKVADKLLDTVPPDKRAHFLAQATHSMVVMEQISKRPTGGDPYSFVKSQTLALLVWYASQGACATCEGDCQTAAKCPLRFAIREVITTDLKSRYTGCPYWGIDWTDPAGVRADEVEDDDERF